ncbi:MAG: hypothetical protein Greene041662_578 [Candidatus Peregrinibacteria bacterium Greene0416_62]|nr:MAG: hypothetical protein Greene041662_578 [Candidatus Peregrinibacteria bacterium Greene0416_62]
MSESDDSFLRYSRCLKDEEVSDIFLGTSDIPRKEMPKELQDIAKKYKGRILAPSVAAAIQTSLTAALEENSVITDQDRMLAEIKSKLPSYNFAIFEGQQCIVPGLLYADRHSDRREPAPENKPRIHVLFKDGKITDLVLADDDGKRFPLSEAQKAAIAPYKGEKIDANSVFNMLFAYREAGKNTVVPEPEMSSIDFLRSEIATRRLSIDPRRLDKLADPLSSEDVAEIMGELRKQKIDPRLLERVEAEAMEKVENKKKEVDLLLQKNLDGDLASGLELAGLQRSGVKVPDEVEIDKKASAIRKVAEKLVTAEERLKQWRSERDALIKEFNEKVGQAIYEARADETPAGEAKLQAAKALFDEFQSRCDAFRERPVPVDSPEAAIQNSRQWGNHDERVINAKRALETAIRDRKVPSISVEAAERDGMSYAKDMKELMNPDFESSNAYFAGLLTDLNPRICTTLGFPEPENIAEWTRLERSRTGDTINLQVRSGSFAANDQYEGDLLGEVTLNASGSIVSKRADLQLARKIIEQRADSLKMREKQAMKMAEESKRLSKAATDFLDKKYGQHGCRIDLQYVVDHTLLTVNSRGGSYIQLSFLPGWEGADGGGLMIVDDTQGKSLRDTDRFKNKNITPQLIADFAAEQFSLQPKEIVEKAAPLATNAAKMIEEKYGSFLTAVSEGTSVVIVLGPKGVKKERYVPPAARETFTLLPNEGGTWHMHRERSTAREFDDRWKGAKLEKLAGSVTNAADLVTLVDEQLDLKNVQKRGAGEALTKLNKLYSDAEKEYTNYEALREKAKKGEQVSGLYEAMQKTLVPSKALLEFCQAEFKRGAESPLHGVVAPNGLDRPMIMRQSVEGLVLILEEELKKKPKDAEKKPATTIEEPQKSPDEPSLDPLPAVKKKGASVEKPAMPKEELPPSTDARIQKLQEDIKKNPAAQLETLRVFVDSIRKGPKAPEPQYVRAAIAFVKELPADFDGVEGITVGRLLERLQDALQVVDPEIQTRKDLVELVKTYEKMPLGQIIEAFKVMPDLTKEQKEYVAQHLVPGTPLDPAKQSFSVLKDIATSLKVDDSSSLDTALKALDVLDKTLGNRVAMDRLNKMTKPGEFGPYLARRTLMGMFYNELFDAKRALEWKKPKKELKPDIGSASEPKQTAEFLRNQRKLDIAKRAPDRWIAASDIGGTEGYLYCYVSKSQTLYARNKDGSILFRFHPETLKHEDISAQSRENLGLPKDRTPEYESNQRKLDAAKRAPDRWIAASEIGGTEGYSYCYVSKSEILYARNKDGSILFRFHPETLKHEDISAKSRKDLGLPEERSTEKERSMESTKKETTEAQKSSTDTTSSEPQKLTEVQRKNQRKIDAAKLKPDRWLQAGEIGGTEGQGYTYCYVATSETLYVRNRDGSMLWRFNSATLQPETVSLASKEGLGLPKERSPEYEKNQRKLDIAKARPGLWLAASEMNGAQGFVYCYEANAAKFYAYHLGTRTFQVLEDAGIQWSAQEWREGMPRLPDYLFTDKGPQFIGRDGQRIASFEVEKTRGISEAKYVEMVRASVTNADAYHTLEELFIDPSSGRSIALPEQVLRGIREHGKKITGLDNVEAALEKDFGISIETEVAALGTEIKAAPHSLRSLAIEMPKLRRRLEVYPKEFLTVAKPQTIYLMQHWENLYKGEWLKAGGFSFYGKGIGVKDVDHAIDHELMHTAEYQVGGLSLNNDEWARIAHGADYADKKVYGGKGQDAIASKERTSDRPIGFVTSYAKEGGIDEDQADTANWLIRSVSSYDQVMRWAEQEPPLRAKVEMTKQFYRLHSQGLMDEQFWMDFSSGKTINAQYWEQRRSQRR